MEAIKQQTLFQAQRSDSAHRRIAPSAIGDSHREHDATLYLARMRIADYRVLTIEIGSDEDWWMLDAAFGSFERDQMEIWAEDDQAARMIWPSHEADHVASLNHQLARSHPDGAETFTRPDGVELIVRTCDTNEPIIRQLEAVADMLRDRAQESQRQPALFDRESGESLAAHDLADRIRDVVNRQKELNVLSLPGPDGPVLRNEAA